MKLYAREVISKDTKDRVRLPGLIATEKTSYLLDALESAVTTQPQVLDTFLDILDQYRPSAVIAKKMRDRLHHSVPLKMNCETCHQLFCQHCSITDHKAHQYGLVADVFPKHKKELERELVEVKEHLSILTTAQQAMKDRIDQISVKGKEVEQQIHTATQQAIERLQESEKRTIEMTRKEVQRKSHVVSGQIEELTIKQRQLEEFHKFVDEDISPQQVLTMKRQKVDHVKSIITSSNLQPAEEADIKFEVEKVKGTETEIAMASETTLFKLIASSSFPLPINLLSCQLTAPGSSEPVAGAITSTQSGGCSISYTPAVRGPHQMRITFGGTDIPKSPFTIHVYPTPEMRGEQIGTIAGVTDPQHLAVSKSGEVVVSEGYNCITVFNRDRIKERTFGSAGSDKGQFQSPRGIALTHDNHLLVVDEGNHRIQKFTLEGKFVESIGQKGNGQLQFSYPEGITVHPSSHQVFIADTGNHRIQVLNYDLTYSHEFGYSSMESGHLKHKFNTPCDIACDSHGNVYVVDALNRRVQVLTPRGWFIDAIFITTTLCPTSIAIDSMNTVYISNGYIVAMYNSKRQFIAQFVSKDSTKIKSFVQQELYFAGLAVDYTGNLLHALPREGAIAIY